MTQRFHRIALIAFALLLATPIVGASARPLLRTPDPTTAPADTDAAWLVTIPATDAGWVVIGEASQWIDPACRRAVEERGGHFETVEWAVLEDTTDLALALSCQDIANRWFEDPPRLDEPAAVSSSADTAAPELHRESAGVQLDRGINLAGDFEVTPRRSWGTPIEERFFPLVAARGFDHVRIPIRWSAHTGPAPEHRIDEGFFLEVDRLVDLAADNDLGIVLDVHFFEELDDDPLAERSHFLAIWEQIADRYQDSPSSVVFELLNEPVGVFDDQPELWNRLAADAVALIRQTNPDRTLIIGPVSWNHASRLPDLELPADPNIVATIHTYDPFEFTHQGAVFVDPQPATGVRWQGDARGLALDWADRSWGIDVDASTTGLRIRHREAWSALAMEVEQPVRAERLELTVGRNFDGVVLCNIDLPGARVLEVDLRGRRAVVDTSGCGEIRSLAIQSRTARTVAVNRIALCSVTCDHILLTNEQAIDRLITTAADWARDQGVRLYVGEFGTLSPADDPTDPQSRAAWTNAVRSSAERNGAGWAYFELNGEFGAWDNTTGSWREEIVTALLD